MSPALESYRALLQELMALRAAGPLSQDDEERFAGALNDCRQDMTDEDFRQIAELVAQVARAGKSGAD